MNQALTVISYTDATTTHTYICPQICEVVSRWVNASRNYGLPFLSIPRTITGTSNFEVDGFISISSTSKI